MGHTQDGHAVVLYTCRNSHGMTLKLMNRGATIVEVSAADRDGNFENVVLTCQEICDWEACGSFFGSTVGRYGNRIAKGKFSVDGVQYQLALNNGANHLHGGDNAFDKQIWDAEVLPVEDRAGVRFRYHSLDGEEGYPGDVHVTADYWINDANELNIQFTATTDKRTPLNLTNHTYWNLGGHRAGSILEHQLELNADHYLPVDEGLIPTGERQAVSGTPFDFRQATAIGARIDELRATPAHGYDHCVCVNGNADQLRKAARVVDPKSGRVMEVLTTQPGMQFYTANHLDGGPGSGGYHANHAFCLETQNFPDAPNQAGFPNSFLAPGQTYRQNTVHRFSVQR